MSSGDVNATVGSSTTLSSKPPIAQGFYEQNPVWGVVAIVVSSLAGYNAIELLVMVFMIFKRYKGLYFISFVVSALGLLSNTVSVPIFLKVTTTETHSTRVYILYTFGLVGWAAYVNGLSMVLWSRLHFVLRNQKILRGLLVVIIFNTVILSPLTAALELGANLSYGQTQNRFKVAYSAMEKTEITVFFVQEVVLSAIYVWKSVGIFRISLKEDARRLMMQLFYINVIIICMDVTIISIEYANKLALQYVCKPFVYSVKLKLEFAVLGRLVHFVSVPLRTSPVPNNSLANQLRDSQKDELVLDTSRHDSVMDRSSQEKKEFT